LAESWTIFDNSGETPRMIAFKESGKLEVLDSVRKGDRFILGIKTWG
jgi:predicted ABC-type ATPase